ncbi:tRNA pseudouridine(38-40) synthase TruA [Paenibacillus senegalensis]|uniref:tRNA pseudouridine(38-40) synthase TruA n=1 Tax=Paenibacillus senegalensis TaxID=1465766 RepID=UPI00028A245D|nr:tRNA pseudouridine(38-40) synthase TruA [Paenibacillus senegalensis]
MPGTANRNIKLTVSYDGTQYSGFQIQPQANTVQGELERAVFHLTGQSVKLTSSGRTDAGVHARCQVVNFEVNSSIPIDRWCLALNSRLPKDIVVHTAEEVPMEFHARRSAVSKTYRYSIQRSKWANVMYRDSRLHHPGSLSLSAMEKALKQLEGTHDFTTFCSRRAAVVSHVRTIYSTSIVFEAEPMLGDGDAGVIHIYIQGNGFLYNMVRIIVGTLLQIGEGRRQPEEMGIILSAKNRSLAGPTALAHALTLWDVQYE